MTRSSIISAVTLTASLLLSTEVAVCRPKIRVAVVDTGIHSSLMKESFLCESGHMDFTGTGLNDTVGHGTHVSGLIDQHVKGKTVDSYPMSEVLATEEPEYCQIIVKFYDPKADHMSQATSVLALEYVAKLGVDYVNYSGGGYGYSPDEREAVEKLLDSGAKLVAAAGNNDVDIQRQPYYPAVLDYRIIVVGNMTTRGTKSRSSNYGMIVDVFEVGESLLSYYTKFSVKAMSGTSQATAVHTGKLVREAIRVRKASSN